MSYESLAHSKWDCTYHIVFVPKCRRKKLYGNIRKFLGPIFHELAHQRRSEIIEGNMVQDRVPFDDKNPTEVFCRRSSKLYQRKERYRSRQTIWWSEKEL